MYTFTFFAWKPSGEYSEWTRVAATIPLVATITVATCFLLLSWQKQPTFRLLTVIREYVSVESLPVGPNRRTGERSVSVTLCICWEEHPLYADWNWCLTSLHDVQITCVYRRWQNDAHGLWYLTVDMGETRVNTEYGERRIIGDRGRSPDISP